MTNNAEISKINLVRPEIVIFDGPDGAGKTTTLKAFDKATSHLFRCIDRWSGSFFVYQGLSAEELAVDDYTLMHRFKVWQVLLVASPEVLAKRREGEHEFAELYVQVEKYKEWQRATKFPTLMLWTDRMSQDEVVEAIRRWTAGGSPFTGGDDGE